MKDLKHYFSSPKQNEENIQVSNEPPYTLNNEVNKNNNKSLLAEDSTELPVNKRQKKSKKRKKKDVENDCDLSLVINIDSENSESPDCSKRKKRKKSLETKVNLVSTNPFILSKRQSPLNRNESSPENSNVKIEEKVPAAVEVGEKKGKKSLSNKKKKKTVTCITNQCLPTEDSVGENLAIVNRNEPIEKKENGELLNIDKTSLRSILPVDVPIVIDDSPDVEVSGKKLNSSKKKKKEKREVVKENSKLRESLCSDTDSSPKVDDPVLLSAPSNKILNYFTKVDKLPEIPQQPKTLKVEAVVHFPPSDEKRTNSVKMKRKMKNKRNLSEDLDLITSEEDNSKVDVSVTEARHEMETPSRKPWKLRVQLSTSQEDSEFEEPLCIEIEDSQSKSGFEDVHIAATKEFIEEEKTNDEAILIKEDEETVFDIDNSSSSNSVIISGVATEKQEIPIKKLQIKPKSDGTLASFFVVKNTSKTVPGLSKEEKAAKQKFLESGVPENMKKLIKIKPSETSSGNPAPFPKCSHVQQKDLMSVLWNLPSIRLKLKPPPVLSSSENHKWTSFLEKSLTKNLRESFSVVNNIKRSVKDLKKELKNYPISSWHKEMKSVKKKNDGEIWTEKYKPRALDHFIANQNNVQKLKNWLENHKAKTKIDRDDVSSGDEFQKSDDEVIKIQNTALLVGPSGTGKTSAVYALANEIGYQVLELNATCNRSGKRVLLEFSEATQSHKVETNSNIFGKVKKQKKKEETKRSLILVEDADLAFQDYDDGFISAVSCLAESSKRPLVLIANDENCKHLSKLISHCQLHLHFVPAKPQKLGCWLRTLGLGEGISLDESTSSYISQAVKGDIRKAVLQTQFYTSSTSPLQLSKMCCENLELNGVWGRAANFCLTKQDDSLEARKLLKSVTTFDVLSKHLSSKLVGESPCRRYWDKNVKDSTSLEEVTLNTDFLTTIILEEIYELAKKQETEPTDPQDYNHLSSFRDSEELGKVLIEAEEAISTSVLLCRRGVVSDYLPAIRAMAISENHRLVSQTKRNNRFLNHLQTLGISLNETVVNTLASAFPKSEDEPQEEEEQIGEDTIFDL